MNTRIIYILLVVLYSFAPVYALTDSISLDDYTLDIEYDEDDVNAGETFRITVTVINEAGEERNDIEIEMDFDDVFDNVGDTDKKISRLDDDDEASVSFRLEIDEDASEGDYEVEFSIRDSQGADDNDDILIEVKNDDPELIIGEKISSPSLITADLEDIKLTLKVENIGVGDAKFTRASLILPDGITQSGSFGLDTTIGTIESGGNKEVVFYIDTDKNLQEGNLPAELLLEYDDEENNRQTERIVFDIPIKGKAQFEITSVSFDPSLVRAGDEGTLIVTVKNNGADKGEETTIRVFEHSDLPIEFSQKTGLVGDLEPFESGQASISFNVDSDAISKRYLIRAQTRTITNGIVSVEDFTIPITIHEREKGSPVLYLFAAVIVLFIVLLVMIFRRR